VFTVLGYVVYNIIIIIINYEYTLNDTITFFQHFSQWRNKVAVGPRASIPKGHPLPKKQRRANFGPPQRWARVHCTPCTPYCYATDFSSITVNSFLALAENEQAYVQGSPQKLPP